MGNRNATSIKRRNKILSTDSEFVSDETIIVWLDESNDTTVFKSEFRPFVNCIRIFFKESHCEEYLRNNIHRDAKIFLIVSDRFAEQLIPHVHQLSIIESIYIFCNDATRVQFWSNKYSKLDENIFVTKSELYQKLRVDLSPHQNDLIRIDLTDDKSNHLAANFMYSQLLKETLINIKYDPNCKREFLGYCIEQSQQSHSDQMKIIEEFENDYEKHCPIWWYTRECFLYEMMNKALRTGNIDVLIKMGFFIRDLHEQIQSLYFSEKHSPIVVYRGQGMTNHQFQNVCQYDGGLISFQTFLSTSHDRQVALKFAQRAIAKPGIRGIIFRMTIDPNRTHLSNPYASVKKLSYFQNREKEVLFSTHTVFRIEQIQQIKDESQIWQVNLRLTTTEDDRQLQQLTKHLRQDLQLSSNPWESLAKLLLTMNQFDNAQEIYENILEKTSPDDNEQLAYISHQLGCVHNGKTDLDQARRYFQQSLEIKIKYLPEKSKDPQLADTYSNLGSIDHAQDKLDDALTQFHSALQTKTTDQRILASVYNNIGMVLKKQGQVSQALEYFQESLRIDQTSLPPTHPDLATTYSNLGRVYLGLKDYCNAFTCYQQTFHIRQLSLPENHPLLLQAIANYQDTAGLLSQSSLQSPILSTLAQRRNQSFHSRPSTRSGRLINRLSTFVHIMKIQQ